MPTSTPFDEQALTYHADNPPGKTSITITKSTETEADLSLAYTPGVAIPVTAIANDPENAYRYTNKGNLIGVITNGSAILGLGNLGPLAAKPVMEGKAVLFKKLANVDAFDIELSSQQPQEIIETICNLAPTFGGINLEDVKAPDCFTIMEALQDRLDIPVFHDDQEGTAIVMAAGLLNALTIQNKKIEDVQIVCLGAGAAAIASMRWLIDLGANRNHIRLVDRNGVVHLGREDINVYKKQLANSDTSITNLKQAMENADVFVGLSGANLLPTELLASMAPKPIIFALSNPTPEIDPEIVAATRPDALLATGRSDLPNQINNVLCFPYIFRGALDAKATHINQAMRLAATHTIAQLATAPPPQSVIDYYPSNRCLEFGPKYFIPTPFDPRLRTAVSQAVNDAWQS